MPDPNIVLAKVSSPAAARDVASELAAAFDEHFAYLQTHHDELDELTPPLRAFAERVGFAWHKDDTFSWDDDPLDPALRIGSAGPLVYYAHAAARQIAEHGVQTFMRARGATNVIAWRADTTPLTLSIRFTSEIGVKWFLANAATVMGTWVDEEQFVDGEPPATDGTFIAFSGPGLAIYVETGTSWVVLDCLRGVAGRPDVEIDLQKWSG